MLLPRRIRLSLIASGWPGLRVVAVSWGSDVIENPYPQPEGYSYVNLAVVKTVGSAPSGIGDDTPTRREAVGIFLSCRTGQGQDVPAVVGWPGTLTS